MIRGKFLLISVAAFVALAVMLAEESEAKRYDVHKKPYAPPPPAVHHRPTHPVRPPKPHVVKPIPHPAPHRPGYPKRRHHRQADYYEDSASDEADEDSVEDGANYDEK